MDFINETEVSYSNSKKYNNNIISKEFISGYRYLRNNVFEELMSYVWHPSRVEKWKYLDNDIDL